MKIWIWVIILVVIILGAYFVFSGTGSSEPATDESAAVEAEDSLADVEVISDETATEEAAEGTEESAPAVEKKTE